MLNQKIYSTGKMLHQILGFLVYQGILYIFDIPI